MKWAECFSGKKVGPGERKAQEAKGLASWMLGQYVQGLYLGLLKQNENSLRCPHGWPDSSVGKTQTGIMQPPGEEGGVRHRLGAVNF